MATLTITSQDPVVLTLDGEIQQGQVVADLRPSAIAGDSLQRSENLADLSNPAVARTNLGASSVGSSVFTAASGDAAMTAMGMSANGRDIVKAASGSTARIFLGLSSFCVSGALPDIVSANAATAEIFVGGGTVIQAWAASTVAATGGDIVLTVKYAGTAFTTVSGLPFRIAEGSKTGHTTFVTSSSLVANPNVPIEVDVSGGNTAAGLVNLTLDVSPPDVG